MNQAIAREREAKDFLNLIHPSKSLLIIEDDLSLIELIDGILDDLRPGIEWEYVTSGEKAMERINSKAKKSAGCPFSLVIADIFLEGEMTGFDVWLECRALYPKMPFVITSCLSFDRYFSILRGVNDCPVYLPKPLTMSRCQAVLEEYI